MLKRFAIAGLTTTLVAIATVPLRIDQPSGAQSAGTLSLAYRVAQWSPLLTLVGAVPLTWMAATGWRRANRIGRAGLTIAVMLAVLSAWFARQNPFEWMFNPLRDAAFVGAQDASFVAAEDLVLAVTVARDAAAYPIRQMAYHQVVNDIVGGVPAIVTY